MCTLFGALPGESLVTGANYVKVGYGLDVADIWRRNLLVLFGFMILFQITQVVLIELFPHFDGGSAITIFAHEDGETKKLNDTLDPSHWTFGQSAYVLRRLWGPTNIYFI